MVSAEPNAISAQAAGLDRPTVHPFDLQEVVQNGLPYNMLPFFRMHFAELGRMHSLLMCFLL